ncbi:hypothetical protein K439DRAFT_1649194 [Ramaria rubella]|nr:hypothetical protein K439DRAFT_1649194 [Ramaria rubella]
MHAPTLNIGGLLVPLWPTDSVETWPWDVLTGETWKAHGQAVGDARSYIPGSYDYMVNTGYKAKEWQGYLYSLAPALLYGILPDDIWENFCLLVHAIWILHQHSIPRVQLEIAQRYLDEFHIGFKRLYVQCWANQIHFVRPCIHTMLHLGLEVPRLGPPILHSAWTIERTMGDLGGERKQLSNPYANLSERSLKRCQLNALKALIPAIVKNVKKSSYSTIDLGDGYKLLTARERTAQSHGGRIGEAIQVYIIDIARCAWKECTQASHNLRMARKVKFRYKGRIEYGEVMFYFCLELEGSRHGLALMSMYSRPDECLLQDSHWMVYSVAQLPEEIGLRVINATSIFVWEQIGLEMSILSGCTEVDEL